MTSVKILIVEDELLIANNLARKLTKLGYEIVEIVSSGENAIRIAGEKKPDLVLMDIVIKGDMDGIQAAAQIAKKYGIPVIYLTAYADIETLNRAKETTPFGYILKPFKDRELQVTIEIALQKYQADLEQKRQYMEELKGVEQKFSQVQKFDPLTKLLNRHGLQEEFDQQVEEFIHNLIQPKETSPSYFPYLPLFCLSFDRLERLYQSLDPANSDLLILTLTERLKSVIAENGIVARINSNEFIIVARAIEYRTQAVAIAQSLLQSISDPILINSQEIFITASIGCAFYYHPYHLETLLQHCRLVITKVQKSGGNAYEFYNHNLDNTTASKQIPWESDLHHALEFNQFQLYFQPIVNIKTGEIVSAEALIRWLHPKHGMILPKDFIPIAEQQGLMIELGKWVFRNALRCLVDRKNAGLPMIKISVNLAARQLSYPALSQELTNILIEQKVSAKFISLEVDESIFEEDSNLNVRRLRLIKALGFEITLDSFGSDKSSLNYLSKFPFDTVKMDSSLAKNLKLTPANETIVASIIDLARKLNMEIVAKGVERKNELQFFYEHQCYHIQGNLFSRPIPASEFISLANVLAIPSI
ncbi:GGDEF domain-containing response regulator [Anabaena sp. UHCC 0187]|uniref:two-component system response regulator n=1 Tax=Anabaena sp. UHCC 0187 TaxID=2590018 RepID=UPI00144849A4|nr:EAL domain-containing protein [Anabaena sp. UHCC 0187]MTJ14539.1 GGDEF domain-containing response regulator [Anabaena sp. UHCC 0187]